MERVFEGFEETLNDLNFKMQFIQGKFQWALLIFGIWLIMQNVSMLISRIIALVYDPVKPCCFNSQVNIYLDDFQLSKTVFILARFCPNKLFKSADKGCLILVPRSDLFRPRDFYGFDRFEISHFLPYLR